MWNIFLSWAPEKILQNTRILILTCRRTKYLFFHFFQRFKPLEYMYLGKKLQRIGLYLRTLTCSVEMFYLFFSVSLHFLWFTLFFSALFHSHAFHFIPLYSTLFSSILFHSILFQSIQFNPILFHSFQFYFVPLLFSSTFIPLDSILLSTHPHFFRLRGLSIFTLIFIWILSVGELLTGIALYHLESSVNPG